VEWLIGHGRLDVLILHDAPAGVEFFWRRKDGSVCRRYVIEADGLAQAVSATRPMLCFFGHHHTRLDAEVAGLPCIGLNKVRCPGNLWLSRSIPADVGSSYSASGLASNAHSS